MTIIHSKLRLIILVFFHLITGLVAFGQTITGTVTDSTTHKPIAYASVGFEGTNIGTICDSLGHFLLDLPTNQNINPEFKISSVGYTDKFFGSKDTSQIFMLSGQSPDLNEVLVISNKKKKHYLGRLKEFSKLSVSSVTFNPGRVLNKESITKNRGTAIARMFKWNKKHVGKLSDFRFIIYPSGFENITFRIIVIDANTKKSLLNHDLFYNWKRRDSIKNHIGLDGENIKIKNDFIVGLEWIKETVINKVKDYNIVIPTALTLDNNTLYRSASQDDWKKINNVSISFQVGLLY